MDVCFRDQALHDLCVRRANLISRFGPELARKIATRLSVLVAAPTLDLVPMAPPIGLMATDTPGTYSMALGADHRLVFEVDDFDRTGSPGMQTVIITKIAEPVPTSANTGGRS